MSKKGKVVEVLIGSDALESAIKKALNNGWDPFGIKKMNVGMGGNEWRIDLNERLVVRLGHTDKAYSHQLFIYTHDFAKALWPTDWADQLKEMVVAEDPIEYIGGHLTT